MLKSDLESPRSLVKGNSEGREVVNGLACRPNLFLVEAKQFDMFRRGTYGVDDNGNSLTIL